LNINVCYGMGAETFQSYAFKNYGIVMSIEEAQERRNNWMKSYADQARTIERIKKEFFDGRDNYIVRTLLNRFVHPDMYTDAVNIPIQGGISEVAKLWLHYSIQLNKKEENLPFLGANFVHDSVAIETIDEHGEYWKDIILRGCDKAWKYYMSLPGVKIPTVDMPVEVGISKKYQGVS